MEKNWKIPLKNAVNDKINDKKDFDEVGSHSTLRSTMRQYKFDIFFSSIKRSIG